MKDNVGAGIVLGAICPLIAFLLTNFTEVAAVAFPQKPIGIYVIAAAINLIAVRFIYRRGQQATAKGMVLITFLAMLAMVVGTQFQV